MATFETVKKVFAAVYFKFPSRKPTERAEVDMGLRMWAEFYKQIQDQVLMDALARFVGETTKIYPDDCPFSKIREMAGVQAAGCVETQGDIIELANEAVSRFGSYRADEAMTWIESKSPIAAATMRRFGFREYCFSTSAEVARGQLRALFQEERERAARFGVVVDSAKNLEGGKAVPAISADEARFRALIPEGKKVPA